MPATRGIYNSTAPTLVSGEQAQLQLDSAGRLLTNQSSSTPPTLPTTSTLTATAVSVASAGDNTALAGTALQTIRVFAVALTFDSPVDATLKDGAGTTLGVFQGVTSLVLDPFPLGLPRYVLSAGNDFMVNLSSAVACKGTIWTTKS